jgi:hypothetical protein
MYMQEIYCFLLYPPAIILSSLPSLKVSGFHQKISSSRSWWLMLVILTTGEAEIRRSTIQGQSWQIAPE